MKLKPLDDRMLCKVVDLPEDYGQIIIPERFRKQYGMTATGAPHVLCQVLGHGPNVTEEVSIGDYVLVDGLNLEAIPPGQVQGEKDVCLPRDKAVLVVFGEPPVGNVTDA